MSCARTGPLGVTVVMALLTACGTGPTTASTATATPKTDVPTATPPADGSTRGAPAFPKDTAAQLKQSPAQRDLVFTDVRVGEHEDFDRIVLEFSGAGPLGWQVNYVDEAVLEGSGDVVTLSGDEILVVVAHYNLWPAPDYYSGPRRFEPQDAGSISDIFVGGTFEGYTQMFAGIEGSPVPFRVFELTNPSRLVVDVADESAD